MKTIIFISGKIGSGKDTTANALKKLFEEREDVSYKRVLFAGPLKLAVSAMTGIPLLDGGTDFTREQKRDEQVPISISESISLRKFMQEFGSECIRGRWDEFWVAAAKRDIVNHVSKNEKALVCITDCRFKNELVLSHHLKNTLFKSIINSNVKILTVRLKGNPGGVLIENPNHPSETDLDDVEDQFDLIYDTEKLLPDEIATDIYNYIIKK